MDFSDFLGIPYKHHGRTLDGADCYGLWIMYQEWLGRTALDFDYKFRDYRNGQDYNVWKASMDRWTETAVPDKDDTLLFFDDKGRVVHIAVFVGGGRILHCDIKGSRVERLDTFYYQNWKAYRWRQ